jgi:hypothetical protein
VGVVKVQEKAQEALFIQETARDATEVIFRNADGRNVQKIFMVIVIERVLPESLNIRYQFSEFHCSFKC